MPKNHNTPSFSQIYMFDSSEQLQVRLQLMPDLDSNILECFQTMLHEVNPYVHVFQNAACILNENSAQDIQIVITKTRNNLQYTTPTASEIAVLVVRDGQEVEPSNRDIILRKQGGGLQRISEIHYSYTPLHYVLLFPYG